MNFDVPEEALEDYADTIGDVLMHSINENTLIQRMEKYFSPYPARLGVDEESTKTLQSRVNELIEDLGGPPTRFLVISNEEIPKYDTFSRTALKI